VTRGAAFDLEPNDDVDNAVFVGGGTAAMGHVTGDGVATLFSLRGTVSTEPIVLAGDKITLGIATDGSFITNNSAVGIQFNGAEFVTPGSPIASFTVAYGGQTY